MIRLSIKNITKKYGSAQVLHGVSFDIHEGEVISLLGVNGAGKSTLSNIISTLCPPTSGDIFYNGKSIYEDLMAYRFKIGLCPQHPNLHPELSIEQNLYFAGRAYHLTHKEATARTQELISVFSLEKYRDSKPKTLSGGYKQRALLARTLMHDPDIIILDEPTVGLDPHIRKELWQEIDILRKKNKSVILTTHYMDEAEQLSDRVVMLDKGVVKFIDTPQNLKRDFKQSNLESIFIQLTKTEELTESENEGN